MLAKGFVVQIRHLHNFKPACGGLFLRMRRVLRHGQIVILPQYKNDKNEKYEDKQPDIAFAPCLRSFLFHISINFGAENDSAPPKLHGFKFNRFNYNILERLVLEKVHLHCGNAVYNL